MASVQTASNETTCSIALLPDDVFVYLLKNIADVSDKSDLCSVIRVNQSFYDQLSPKLYERIEVSKDNYKDVFWGLDYNVSEQNKWTKINGNENKSYGAALAGHKRKLSLLNKVKNLVILDAEGAKAIAESLNPLYSVYIDDQLTNLEKARHPSTVFRKNKPTPMAKCSSLAFANVQTISLHYNFLISTPFYPRCGLHGDPEPHPVIAVLAKGLDCQHICLDARAAEKFGRDDDMFGPAIDLLTSDWKFKTLTWHNTDFFGPMPCSFYRPRFRYFFDHLPGDDSLYGSDNEHDFGIIRKPNDTLNQVIAYCVERNYWCCAHPRKEEETIIEIAYPGYKYNTPVTPKEIIKVAIEYYKDNYYSLSCGEFDYRTSIKASEKRWKERESTGWFEKYLKVVNSDDAAACVCCGEK